ncbi:hypothetical protein EXIGLDRAFT_728448 [Exidia glandulosa HHB12029]|uniref:MYND-type domain-containing protein n=1 Tax=Exidia glandulosa HHB12029 TaxID=1314781 RepID=A0A165CXF3_EXIGL|nr:hypothetical protein EXIGLDRAFT_728448 [Exidia glandulosa HHB12029]
MQDTDETSQGLAELRRDHHGLLNAALSYIVTEARLDEDTLARQRQLELWVRRCMTRTRDTTVRIVHQCMLPTLASGVTHLDIDMLCTLLSHSLIAAGRDATRRFSRHLWPTKVEDLFPAGEEVTIRALCIWVQRLDSTQIISLVHSLYRACKVELQPHYGLIIDALVTAFESIVSELVQTSASVGVDDDMPVSRQPTLRLDDIAALLSDLSPSLYRCCSDPPFLRRVVNAVSASLDVATTASTVKFLSRIGEGLYALYSPPLAVHPRIKQQMLSQRHRTVDPFETLYGELLDTYNQHACGWPSCRVTERETGRSLSVCARCRLLRYCSQECQKKHWRSTHKSVCTDLGRLFATLNIPKFSAALPESAFITACRDANFSDDDISMIARIYGLIAAEDPTLPVRGGAKMYESIWLGHYHAEKDGNMDMIQVLQQAVAASARDV